MLRLAGITVVLGAALLGLTGCGESPRVETAAGEAPRIAEVDTRPYGPVLALHGPTPEGNVLVLCSASVLEFDPRERMLAERCRIDAPFPVASACFVEVPERPEPFACVLEYATFGGVQLQELDGRVHIRIGPFPRSGRIEEHYPQFGQPGEPDFLLGSPTACAVSIHSPDWTREWMRVLRERGSADDSAPILHGGVRDLAAIVQGVVTVGDRAIFRPGADQYVNSLDVPHSALGVPVPDRVMFSCYDRELGAQRWYEHALDTGETREISELEHAGATQPERHATGGGLALRGELLLEQAPVAGFSDALVRIEARSESGALAWRDEFRCAPGLRPLPRSAGSLCVLEVEGRSLAVLGHAAGLALYDLGAVAR